MKIPAIVWAGGGLAILYLLCKRGKLPLQVCNMFNLGLPGFTLFGAGGSVTIGQDEVKLANLLKRLNLEGIGEEPIRSLKKGDWVPKQIAPIGSTVNYLGKQWHIVGYARTFFNHNLVGAPELFYTLQDRQGEIKYVHPTSINSAWVMVRYPGHF